MNVVLGVSSGIAIYKAVDLLSKMRKEGWDVQVIMTENAAKLVSPVVFSAVGNCRVFTDTYEIESGWIIHTELSKWADVFVVAPATANTIAKLANGFADNLLTTTALAFQKSSKIIVPTMNTRMYENPVTVDNLKRIQQVGWYVLEPESGHLACGEVGKGRYPDNEKIIEFIKIIVSEKPLAGRRILVTAGPTQEEIDPVRFISNHSSGKMGYAIARVAKMLGAQVCLVSGPTCLTVPYFLDEVVFVRSANEMYHEVLERAGGYDILIMCAAVADYAPSSRSAGKIKKIEDKLILELVKTPDILAALGQRKKGNQIVVGFAAETEHVVENAIEKLVKKNIDVIVANDVSEAMGKDTNHVYIISRNKAVVEVEGTKDEVAKELLLRICENFC
uniref:Coenzyme A biosynthesis bifunctional protein CoaBC n=1 Tax=Fervidobacterium thailandense TaxID=1008305 RepID=A0A7C4GIF9_9BACT